MKAAILAAGIGSRLRPLTDEVPKCLVKVAGRPILGHQLAALKSAGIREVIIVTGHKAEHVAAYCRQDHGLHIRCVVNEHYDTTNNMYSAYLLRNVLKGQDFVLCNGDVIYDEGILAKAAASRGDMIAVDPTAFHAEAMKVVLADGHIAGIRKLYGPEESYGCSVDLYRLSADGAQTFFREIEAVIEREGNVSEWTEVALDRLCRDRRVLFKPLDIAPHRWVEIDDHEDLARADRLFSEFTISKYDVFFLDMDGTLAIGEKPVDGAAHFVQHLRDMGKGVYFVSNNSSRSKRDYVIKLAKMGISTDEAEIILSTDGLGHLLRTKSIRQVFCLGTESMRRQLAAEGITHVEEDPEAVVVGYDTELTYDKLRKACGWINRRVPWYATHPDVFCPSADGPIPDIGTLIKTIEMTTGQQPVAVCGKPNAEMLSHIVGTACPPEKAVLIGDRLCTDKLLAERLGIDFVCVLSGETRREDLQSLGEDEWPTLVTRSIAEIQMRC